MKWKGIYFHMKLISWNVNGLRACLTKGFSDFFLASDADFFCLQETKMQPDQADIHFEGYHLYWHSAVKKGYSGTAIFAKKEPLSISRDFGLDTYNDEGRVLTLEYDHFYLVTAYVPNSQRELARLDYRLDWESAFREHLTKLDSIKPVILCGDLNVAHQEIDLKNPKTNTKNAGFTIEERTAFTQLLENGFVDTFRYLYPDQTDAYTWWSYMFQARSKNVGWRIDYFVVSNRITNYIEDSKIHADILGSDHCPVEILLKEGF